MPGWMQQLLQEVRETSPLEWTGVTFGVAEVLLARANKAALYPCGIISVIITSWIYFFDAHLYAESLLNLYYLVMSIYGWWIWTKQKQNIPLAITIAGRKDWLITAGIVAGGSVALYFALAAYTDSTVPRWDAFVSATAWAGMWLLARRKVENWLLLNLSNAFAVPLLFFKHQPLYALLTIFLFVVAVAGYFDWRKIALHAAKVQNH